MDILIRSFNKKRSEMYKYTSERLVRLVKTEEISNYSPMRTCNIVVSFIRTIPSVAEFHRSQKQRYLNRDTTPFLEDYACICIQAITSGGESHPALKQNCYFISVLTILCDIYFHVPDVVNGTISHRSKWKGYAKPLPDKDSFLPKP